jgi:hypothetical protein
MERAWYGIDEVLVEKENFKDLRSRQVPIVIVRILFSRVVRVVSSRDDGVF